MLQRRPRGRGPDARVYRCALHGGYVAAHPRLAGWALDVSARGRGVRRGRPCAGRARRSWATRHSSSAREIGVARSTSRRPLDCNSIAYGWRQLSGVGVAPGTYSDDRELPAAHGRLELKTRANQGATVRRANHARAGVVVRPRSGRDRVRHDRNHCAKRPFGQAPAGPWQFVADAACRDQAGCGRSLCDCPVRPGRFKQLLRDAPLEERPRRGVAGVVVSLPLPDHTLPASASSSRRFWRLNWRRRFRPSRPTSARASMTGPSRCDWDGRRTGFTRCCLAWGAIYIDPYTPGDLEYCITVRKVKF